MAAEDAAENAARISGLPGSDAAGIALGAQAEALFPRRGLARFEAWSGDQPQVNLEARYVKSSLGVNVSRLLSTQIPSEIPTALAQSLVIGPVGGMALDGVEYGQRDRERGPKEYWLVTSVTGRGQPLCCRDAIA